MKFPIIQALLLLIALGVVSGYSKAEGANKQPEKTYQEAWCAGASETLSDGTRADCLIPGYAIEVDFAKKWYEAVGQSLHYARLTGRRPGILLIIEEPKECRYLKRLQGLAVWIHPNITVWTTGPSKGACHE